MCSYKIEPAPFVKNAIFFLQCVLLTIGVWAYICLFNSIPLINVTVFIPIPFCFYYYSSLIQLEFENGDTSSSFIFQDCFDFCGSFATAWDTFSSSIKIVLEFQGRLHWIYWPLGRMACSQYEPYQFLSLEGLSIIWYCQIPKKPVTISLSTCGSLLHFSPLPHP